MCIDMCMDMRMDMCMDMCIDMCMDMRIDMCMDMCVDLHTAIRGGICHGSTEKLTPRRGRGHAACRPPWHAVGDAELWVWAVSKKKEYGRYLRAALSFERHWLRR